AAAGRGGGPGRQAPRAHHAHAPPPAEPPKEGPPTEHPSVPLVHGVSPRARCAVASSRLRDVATCRCRNGGAELLVPDESLCLGRRRAPLGRLMIQVKEAASALRCRIVLPPHASIVANSTLGALLARRYRRLRLTHLCAAKSSSRLRADKIRILNGRTN